MHMLIKHVKIQSKNYYLMVIKLEKEGEINGKSKNSENNKSKT